MEINLRGLSLQVRGRAQRHTLDPNIHTSTHDMLTTTEEPVHTKLAHAREPATMYTISARIKSTLNTVTEAERRARAL